MKRSLTLLFVLFSISIFPQQAGSWKIYSSMKIVNDFVISGNSFWGATTGGAFQFIPKDSTYNKFTKVEGMSGISITSTTADKSGNIWFGSSNGALDYYNTSTKKIESITDIQNSDKTNKQIYSLQTSGDTIVAATDFGICLIDPRNIVLYDTFIKFGSLLSNSKINFAVKYDLIYAGSDNGVIIQIPGTTNLSAPESWNVFNVSNGLPSNKINKIIRYNNQIIAGSDHGLASFNGTGFDPFLPEMNNHNINDLFVSNDSLYVLEGNLYVHLYVGGINTVTDTFPIPVNHIKYDATLGLSGSSGTGIIKIKNNQTSYIFPNGPFANLFQDLGVDNNGTLWVASGTDVSGVGFYSLNSNGYWTNYNTSTNPILPTNFYFKVFNASDNSTYIGNWGRGFVRVKNGNIVVFTKDITGMQGTPSDLKELVVTGFAQDSKNNLWILNFESADRKNLTMLSTDSVYYHFLIPATSSRDLNSQLELIVDQYDTKWYISEDGQERGLIYFNENGTLNDPTDDKSAFVGGLNNNSNVNCIAADKNGDIWVGTGLGVNIVTNTYTIAQSATPQISVSSVFTLRQQSINCILVDPLNQKWIGTNQGLFVVNQDGTTLLNVYDSKNSPLLSDVIKKLAIDESTGTIYVGTDAGLISLKTTSVKPVQSFSGLQVHPSPFIIKNDNKQLTIDGLIANTDIKILTISGSLVREFTSPGGRIAFWDGRDTNGSLVSSGIYIIVAFDKDGNNVAAGKIAVLRE
jgi:ligand-binding sensor domain-containing protein